MTDTMETTPVPVTTHEKFELLIKDFSSLMALKRFST